MANENVNKPFGFRPLGRDIAGNPISGAVRKYYKSASVILGLGDPVVLSGSAEAVTGIPEVTRAAAGATITGVVVGIEPGRSTGLNGVTGYMAAADVGYVYVCDNPNMVFEIQEDSVGGDLAVTDVGRGFDIATMSNANSVTGLSQCVLDSSTGATSGVTLRVIGKVQREDVLIGNYCVWEVVIVEHTYNPHVLI